MKIISFNFFVTFLLWLPFSGFAQVSKPSTQLTRLCETLQGLKVPESVLYDSVSGMVFVSNINGNPAEKDSNGFISRLSPEGKIIDLEWITGLDAPKGMVIFMNHLFITNIDEIVEIDIATAKILERYPVKSSKFLNDLAVNEKGMLFFTDTQTGCVFVLDKGNVNPWLEGELFGNANGLWYGNGFLYIGAGNNILKADVTTGEVLVAVANTGGVDGLFLASDGKFVFSDWKGSVYSASPNGKPELKLNTAKLKENAADFGVIPSKNMILIPTFGNNKVVGYSSAIIN